MVLSIFVDISKVSSLGIFRCDVEEFFFGALRRISRVFIASFRFFTVCFLECVDTVLVRGLGRLVGREFSDGY